MPRRYEAEARAIRKRLKSELGATSTDIAVQPVPRQAAIDVRVRREGFNVAHVARIARECSGPTRRACVNVDREALAPLAAEVYQAHAAGLPFRSFTWTVWAGAMVALDASGRHVATGTTRWGLAHDVARLLLDRGEVSSSYDVARLVEADRVMSTTRATMGAL